MSWLNGKKTIIGAILLLACGVFNEVVVGIWKVDASWIEPTVATLLWVERVGLGFVTVGLAHKPFKPKQ